MTLAGKMVPFAVAGLVAVLMLPADDTAELFGPASTTEPSAPAPSNAAMSSEADAGGEKDPAAALPTYVALNPASTDIGIPDAPDAAAESRLASIGPEVSPAIMPPPDTAVDESSPLDLPPDETTTGSIASDVDAGSSGKPAFVGRQAVNMRVGPSTSTAVITALQPGVGVSIVDMSGGWALVVTEDGDSGWVYSSYLGDRPAATPSRQATQASQPEPPAARPQSSTTPQDNNSRAVRVTSTTVHAGPSITSERLFRLRPGERVRMVERSGNWARVVLRSGASGWVRVN